MCDFVDMSSSSSSSSSEPAPFGPADVDKPWVGFGTGCNGLRSVYLRQPGGYSAEIYVYGGQVMSWKKGAEELLYLSRKAVFEHPFPIRGGIPICFPRFFNDKNMEHHGFARVRLWSIDASPNAATSPDRASTDLILMPSKTDRPNKFDYRIRIILESNGDLTMISRIQNRKGSGKLLTFHFSYHTYFSVSDIRCILIDALVIYFYFKLQQFNLIISSRCSVKFGLKDWRMSIIWTICRTKTDLLKKPKQSLSTLKWTRYISAHRI
ncbi:hypothetical protein ABFX02_11G024300 [Erythranthe guttata]